MATPTFHLRHVLRTINTGDGDLLVMGLQQWHQVEGWEHDDFIKNGGWWEDIPFSRTSNQEDPAPNE